MPDEDDKIELDKLRAVPVITIFEEWIRNAHEEIAASLSFDYGKQPYPCLAVVCVQIKALLSDLEPIIKEYEEREKILDKKYGGTLIDRNYEMRYEEANERIQSLLILWREGGPGQIDKKYDYYPSLASDYIDFSKWGED